MIEVKWSPEGYTAQAAPPHTSHAINITQPMSADALASTLSNAGAHVQDIWDAVTDAERSAAP